MRTIEIKLYQYSELSEAAKKIAILDNLYINVDYDWWDNIYEDAENVSIGITEFNDYGCSIKLEDDAKVVAENIIKEHGENCKTYASAKGFLAKYESLENDTLAQYEPSEELFKEYLQDIEADFIKALEYDYHKILMQECDYLQTTEAIAETLIANEYEFLESGKRYNHA